MPWCAPEASINYPDGHIQKRLNIPAAITFSCAPSSPAGLADGDLETLIGSNIQSLAGYGCLLHTAHYLFIPPFPAEASTLVPSHRIRRGHVAGGIDLCYDTETSKDVPLLLELGRGRSS